jgi:3-hydroxybutyryl-CoA dehydrogenase
MTKGVNYPKGLLAWGDEIGVREVYRRMLVLHDEYGDDRYRPSPMLRRHGLSGERFYP